MRSFQNTNSGLTTRATKTMQPTITISRLAVAEQRVETGLAHGGGDQAEDAERGEADHHLHDRGHRIRDVVDHLAGALRGMAQRDAEADRPRQDADEIGFHQRAHRIGDDAQQQVLEHPRMPPGGLPVAAAVSSTSVVGKAKLAITATTAAAKVPSR